MFVHPQRTYSRSRHRAFSSATGVGFGEVPAGLGGKAKDPDEQLRLELLAFPSEQMRQHGA